MTDTQLIVQALKDLRDRIAENIVSQGANASGRTIESMEVEEYDGGARLLGRPYFWTLESGVRPGAWPGPDTIRRWMIDKGLKTAGDPDLDKAARAINWSIFRNGTVLFREGGRTSIYTDAIDEALERLNEKIYTITAERLADGIVGNTTLRG